MSGSGGSGCASQASVAAQARKVGEAEKCLLSWSTSREGSTIVKVMREDETAEGRRGEGEAKQEDGGVGGRKRAKEEEERKRGRKKKTLHAIGATQWGRGGGWQKKNGGEAYVFSCQCSAEKVQSRCRQMGWLACT